MAKMKVFELKNLINEQFHGKIESKDIQNFLEKSMGTKKTHSSNLEDHEVKAVKEHFVPSAKKTSETPAAKNMRTASNSEIQSKQSQTQIKTTAGRPQEASARPQEQQIRTPGGQSQMAPQGGTQGYPGGTRPAGQGMPRTDGAGMSRPQGQSPREQVPGGQMPRSQAASQGVRPAGQGMQRPQGQQPREQMGRSQTPQGGAAGYQRNTRPAGQGMQRQDGQRPQGQPSREQAPRGQMLSQGAQGYQGGIGQGMQRQDAARPQGQAPREQGYQGRRPQGADRPDYQQRQQGQGTGRPDYQQRQQGQGTGRPDYQQRQQGTGRPDYQQRPQGQGTGRSDYQQRQQGTGRPDYQQRPQGQGTGRPDYQQRQQGAGRTDYQGRNQSGRPDYQQRPQGADRGARPAGQDNRRPFEQGRYRSDQGQQGQRPSGDRPGGYNNNKTGYQRPASRPAGSGQGGYNSRGFEPFNKDEDDKPAYARTQGNRKGSQSGRGNERKSFDQQILDQKVAEKNDFNNKRNRDRMNKDKLFKDKGIVQHDKQDDAISKVVPKKGQFIKPKPVAEVKEEIKVITLPEILTIKTLAEKMKMTGSALIKKLFLAGKIVTINQEITYDEAEEIALEYDIIAEKEIKINEVEELLKEEEEDPATMVKRPPVVCVMGHVDHGKTSLLDAIRHADVTSREAGGITQHIGAYMVEIKGEKITFLDTPGHEAFTSMRMRGAKATDIAILVVAADDGVMPQTVEAISHAKAAGVQIIVAINKIDKPSANIERVKQELTEYELIAEDWGGDTIFVPVSAHTKEGIEQLLEMILLTAEMEELKANPNRAARGLVIEAELDKGRGPVATILVQKGTLNIGDNIVVGSSYGKVRAMVDDKGRRVKEATPSTPVEILGLNSVPDVGEIFIGTDSEKEARTISEAFITQGKERLIADTKAKLSLDGLFSQIQAGNIKELNLIIKADVQGSVEAMKQSLIKLSNDEVAVRIVHGGVGAINESDVILASTSNGIIIGFNVKPDNMAKERAEHENVDIKLYRVIYNAINDVEAAMKGLLDPVYEEKVIGHAQVRQIFKASGLGTIAGSYVLDGKITRGCMVRIYRENELIHEGNLASLKRFQDDVKEVATGYECGLVFEKFHDVREEDKVEFYVMVEVAR